MPALAKQGWDREGQLKAGARHGAQMRLRVSICPRNPRPAMGAGRPPDLALDGPCCMPHLPHPWERLALVMGVQGWERLGRLKVGGRSGAVGPRVGSRRRGWLRSMSVIRHIQEACALCCPSGLLTCLCPCHQNFLQSQEYICSLCEDVGCLTVINPA